MVLIFTEKKIIGRNDVIVYWQAIDFAKEQDDEELWDDLINYSLDKPGISFKVLVNLLTTKDHIICLCTICPKSAIDWNASIETILKWTELAE